MASLIATLAYQLTQVIPETLDDVLLTIECNPLIFDQSLESQLEQLIVQPLLRLQHLFVVFIDGLDECKDQAHQSNLIKLFGNVSAGRNIPIVFLVASRREPQIEAAFVQKEVSNLLRTLPLDNSDVEQTSDDIRRFLTDKFDEIKETHLRKNLLSTDWPPSSTVEEIVAKSSGQFIYASVILNRVSSPYVHPALQLDVIKGMRPRSHSDNPFAHLDALYQYIFSQVKELDFVLNILAYKLAIASCLGVVNEIIGYKSLFQLEAGELEIYLADLAAIVECEPGAKPGAKIKFLHASLPDFLLDKSRSEGYHIDIDKYRTKLLCILLERPPSTLDSRSPTDMKVVSFQEHQRLFAIQDLLEKAMASDRLHRALMSFHFTFHQLEMAHSNCDNCPGILNNLKRLEFNDQGQGYRHVVDLFAASYGKHRPLVRNDYKSYVRINSPDVLARIIQMGRCV